ncbi:hypothetical protein IAT40_000143 [Kwoniella sp. CBS 6097]
MDRFSNSPAPIAGPSRSRTPFRAPLIHLNYQYRPTSSSSSHSVYSHGHGYGSAPSSSRSSTPVLYPNGARFRSTSVVNATQKEDVEIRRKRVESVARLRTAFDLINEKYGSIALEDDDEIDLRTGEIVKDRGKLREFTRREFGEVSESDEGDDIASSVAGGPDTTELGSDEDELGGWDDQSGLDPQEFEHPLIEEEFRPWDTAEDLEDLKEFQRIEVERARVAGQLRSHSEEDERSRASSRSTSVPASLRSEREVDRRSMMPRWRGTEILPARLEDLFSSDGDEERESSSEDELDLVRDSADDEATRKTPAPQIMSDPFLQSEPVTQRRRLSLQVVIPTRSRRHKPPSSLSSSPSPMQSPKQSPVFTRPPLRDLTYNNLMRPVSTPTLADLFNSPPPEASISHTPLPNTTPSSTPSHSRSPSPTYNESAIPLSVERPKPAVRSSSQSDIQLGSPVRSPRLPTVHLHLAGSVKGKERVLGERPNESCPEIAYSPELQEQAESPYYRNFWRTRSGSLHMCKTCRTIGGERASKAALCKGRRGPCPLEIQESQDTSVIPLDPTHSDSDVEDQNELTDLPRSRSSISIQSHTRIRTCRLCREAGGERALLAASCSGRATFRNCKYAKHAYTDSMSDEDRSSVRLPSSTPTSDQRTKTTTVDSDSDDTPLRRPGILRGSQSKSKIKSKSKSRSRSRSEKDIDSDLEDDLFTPLPHKPKPRGRSSVGLTPIPFSSSVVPPRPHDLDPQVYAEGYNYAHNGRPRRCPHCRAAQGLRATRAWWCKGRTWSKQCAFLSIHADAEVAAVQGQAKSSRTADERHLDRLSSTLSDVPDASELEDAEYSDSPLPAEQSRRKRDSNTARAPTRVTTISPAQARPAALTKKFAPTYMPTPPPTSSVEPSSSPSNEDAAFNPIRPLPMARSSSTLSSSMPPSSPLASFSPLVSDNSRLPPLPTPSPSVSADFALHRRTSSPAQQLLISVLPRGGVMVGAACPTPPPSTDGGRSSSVAPDDLPQTVPRKSALRRPSDSNASSSAGSAKRARFSLQPRSPFREASSDPYDAFAHAGENSDDQLSLRHGTDIESSPLLTSSSSLPPRHTASSSSPLRNEWSVRAADVGFKLGPEHTGRISSDMLRALAPALPNFRPTLGSSLGASSSSVMGMTNRFALPEPPPSSGSSFDTKASSRTAVSGSTTDRTSTLDHTTTTPQSSGLMLPPPLPLKKVATPTLSIRVTNTEAVGSIQPGIQLQSCADAVAEVASPTFSEGNLTSRRAVSSISTSVSESRLHSRSHSMSASSSASAPETPQFRSHGVISRSDSRAASARRYITPSRDVSADSGSKSLTMRGTSSTPSRKIHSKPKAQSLTRPRSLGRIERKLARIARQVTDDDGLEWGLDEDCEDEDGGRMWREGSVVSHI